MAQFLFHYCSVWGRKQQPTPVLLPGKFHGWRSLVGYSPWRIEESDTTEETQQQQERRQHYPEQCVCVHCLVMSNPTDGSPPGPPSMGFSRQEHWSGLPFPAPKGTIEGDKVKSLSRVLFLATPWTVAHQAPPSMEFSRQEYRSGLLFPSPH